MSDEAVCRTAPATPGLLIFEKGTYLYSTGFVIKPYMWLVFMRTKTEEEEEEKDMGLSRFRIMGVLCQIPELQLSMVTSFMSTLGCFSYIF